MDDDNKRAAARELARACFNDCKAWARYAHATAARLATMRNAWAAYHAGAAWMRTLGMFDAYRPSAGMARWELAAERDVWVALDGNTPGWNADKARVYGKTAAKLRAENARLREALEGTCGTTGTWAQRVGDGERDWRVRFSFEGETHFATQAEAREAGAAYERIVADAVHGDELAQLRAEVDEASAERESLRGMWRRSQDENTRLRAEVERLRSERDEARAESESMRDYHNPLASFPWDDALTREDGAE